MAEGAPRAVKFVRAQIDALPDERCQALVQIERPGQGVSTATAQGGSGQTDALRAVARATADALNEAFDPEGVKVRVRGVQHVEAFAQVVLIVSLAATRGDETRSLLGVCEGRGDIARAAALAVLNATNRFVGLE